MIKGKTMISLCVSAEVFNAIFANDQRALDKAAFPFKAAVGDVLTIRNSDGGYCSRKVTHASALVSFRPLTTAEKAAIK